VDSQNIRINCKNTKHKWIVRTLELFCKDTKHKRIVRTLELFCKDTKQANSENIRIKL